MAKSKDRKEVYLIEKPKVLPVARMIHEDPKKAERVQLYNEAVKRYDERVQKSLSVIDNVFSGSNIWAISLFNTILPSGERTASLADLGLMVDANPDYTRSFYVDSDAVVLRSAGDLYSSNDYVAKDLVKELGITSFENPVIVRGLGIKEDSDSDYGLVFVPTDKTKVMVAPQLAFSNHKRRFSKTDENGLPLFDDKGTRIFYARDNGLSRLYLGRNLDLDSSYEGLAYSDESGRVVLVRDEVAAPDFMAKYAGEITAEAARQQSELLQRKEQALKLLRGEK